jgi:glycosyltransferase involved in cell wall biosynthesis
MVTPLGIDVDPFYPRPPQATKHPFRVLFVGRIELVKGVSYLLEAFGQLRLPDGKFTQTHYRERLENGLIPAIRELLL